MTITEEPHPKTSEAEPSRQLIVAIAASPGGLPALTELLAALPGDEQMTFIVVQRASPDGREIDAYSLAELGNFKVARIVDGGPVLPGHLYLAPSQSVVRVKKSGFQFRPAHNAGEHRFPADSVFRSVARNFGSRAIGVLLAAEGSDGFIGLEAIGAAGGMTMVQAPEANAEALLTDSIINSGRFDHVLPPAGIAHAIVDYARHWSEAEEGKRPWLRRRRIQEQLVTICAFLREQTGIDFKHYRTTTLLRRIERRMHVLHLASADEYVARLTREPREAQVLARELLIGVTAFFRDPEAFASLAQNALFPLLDNRSPADTVRIWIAACATGEEAYSIAILVREMLEKTENPPKVQIFATDVNGRALAVARRGLYPLGVAANLSPERLARFFIKRGRRFQVTQELREMVTFSAHNVIADPPFSRLDLISCRNLLIYLGGHLQKKLIPLFHYALRRGGYLFLGSSESLGGHGDLFRDIDAHHRLVQRKQTALRTPGEIKHAGRGLPSSLRDGENRPGVELGALAQRIVLDEFAPRYAIVNEEGQIAFLSEGVERFIQPPAGHFSNDILRMARRGLGVGLRTTFAEALRNRRTAVREIAMHTAEGHERIRLTVQPMPELGLDEGLYMMVFEGLGAAAPSTRLDQHSVRPDADRVIEHLDQELLRAREDLDRTVQDLEAANEELKSSNEELLSMNEELQSANEELETSKEETQAANEALWAANLDLGNHLRSIRIATIFLDRHGAIRGFTPPAGEIYHLVTADVGRPLAHFTHVLVDPPPLPSPETIGEEPVEDEVRARDGRWLMRRVLAYLDKSGAVDGLVVTFLDVTRRRHDEAMLRQAEESRRIALDAAAMGMWWWDAGAGNIDADARVRELFGISATEGRLTTETLLSRVDPRDRARIEAIVRYARTGKDRHHIEFRVTAPDGSMRWLTSIGQRAQGSEAKWSGVIFDVTSRKEIEEEAKRATELLDSVSQVTDDLIYVKDRESRLLYANPAMQRLTGRAPSGKLSDWHVNRAEAETIIANDRKVMESRTGAVVEEAFTPPDGKTRVFSSNKKPMFAPDGSVIGIVGVSSDITEYKRLLVERERLIAEVESERARLAAILKDLPAGVVIAEAKSGKISLVNDAAASHLGEWIRDVDLLSEAQAYKMRVADGRALPAAEFPLARALRGEAFRGTEVEITRPDGARRFSNVSATPIRDILGNITAGMVAFVDIGPRRETEALLAASERNYRTLVEQAAVGIEQAALDGRLLAVNDQLCVMLGYSREELLSMTFVDITDPLDLPRERRRHKRLYAGKVDSYVFEKRYVRKNGTRLWARVTSSLQRDETGAARNRISIIQDVSELRRTQQELRESEARYRATFEQAAVGIAHVGLDGRWLAVNDKLCAITGYSREELLRRRFQDITHPDDLDRDLAEMSEVIAGQREILSRDKRYLRKDGAVVWIRLTSALVRTEDAEPAYFISAIEDITRDLHAAATNARLAAIVRSSQDAIYSFDHDHIIGSWNSGAERLFGYRADEIIGQSRAMLMPTHRAHELHEKLDFGTENIMSTETERKRKDGSVFPCVVTKSQIFGPNGQLLGFSSTVRDITERRLAEERQRLMARELVHRVKNSFAVIQSIVRQTQRSTPDPEAFAEAFGGRLAAMAASHDLLTDRHWEGASLRELVASQLAAFSAGAEKRVHVHGPEVTLDTALAVPLGLALHELATNATKYGSLSVPGGSVELSWKIGETEGAESLSLAWREVGGPPVKPPSRRGFGTSLIERGLPDAKIDRRFERDGLVCRIELFTSTGAEGN
ncbi:MAG: PAS domain S-box protein [Hyphomicrobiales bacterium]|nr:PAS domain S-box protein [Hyphomicrobiales bacterium]